MKLKLLPLVLVVLISVQFQNCEKEDVGLLDQVSVIVPVVKSKTAVRNSISIEGARATNSDGKIYVYEDLLFYIAQNSGIHIFDNSDPVSPQNLSFINLEGVNDISIKNNILYADNYTDLVVFDISNLSNIQLVNTEEDMLVFYASWPDEGQYASNFYLTDPDDFVASYETIYMERVLAENNSDYYSLGSNNGDEFFDGAVSSNDVIGTGGSYAKFQIYNNALYTIDDFKLNTFDITDYNNISLSSEVWMEGWFGAAALETTFIRKDYMFIGATNGMHIVGLQDEFQPSYTSSFLHATGCDPVVVKDYTAYITVRGGNSCGAIEDQVNVIDITDITSPVEHSTYFLDSPYGLGIKDEVLYVCNDDGINIFNAQNPANLVLETLITVDAKDLIPLQSHLIAVGENVIHQFNYTEDFGLENISTLQF